MRILQGINYIGGLGADRWIVTGYHDAFVRLGHEHFFWPANESLSSKLEDVHPDVIMIGADRLTPENLSIFEAIRKRGVKIMLFTDSFVMKNPVLRDIVLHRHAVDIYHGETEPEWMEAFVRESGKSYYLTPNGANPKYHFPAQPVKKYSHDIVFLGAMMPFKRRALEMLLVPLKKGHDVKIYGPNWTVGDNMLRLAALVSRKLGAYSVNQWISKLRISVPVDEENQLYSSAKICLNIHERGENIKTHVILNERTFKIPACGGFEICDFVPPLRRYFTEDEMVMADDKKGDWVKDWFGKIDYYLAHNRERKEIQTRGIARAQRDHMYTNRAQNIIGIVEGKVVPAILAKL